MSEGWRDETILGVAEVAVVEQIERIAPQLQLKALGDRKPLRETYVPLGYPSNQSPRDSGLNRLMGDRRIRCMLTIRAGKVVWDADGLSLVDWQNAGPYTNYK